MSKTATLYRMVMDDHLCPFGLKALDLLKREGFEVDDHPLMSQRETEEFKQQHGVKTTPQIFIDGARIGGYDDLKSFLGRGDDGNETSYQPVIAVFATTAAMALATVWWALGELDPIRSLELFVAMSMCVLGILKLRDLESFSNTFITYDLLGMRVVRYAYVYPFIETGAGIAMLGSVLIPVAAPLALCIGVIGGVSVAKAVYIDRRELRCACVGGDSNVPLGFISLTENIMMAGMSVWMLLK